MDVGEEVDTVAHRDALIGQVRDAVLRLAEVSVFAAGVLRTVEPAFADGHSLTLR